LPWPEVSLADDISGYILTYAQIHCIFLNYIVFEMKIIDKTAKKRTNQKLVLQSRFSGVKTRTYFCIQVSGDYCTKKRGVQLIMLYTIIERMEEDEG
jgi:hypothetical protein